MDKKSFWNGLPKPFFALAPMADVTDAAFRTIVAKYGKPDVLWTEFVSADGLFHTREPKRGFTKPPYQDADNALMCNLKYSEAERPMVAQIFGSNPETIAYAAKLVEELGFDGVDLNMGCPDKSIEKQSAGAAMMRDPQHAQEIIRAAQSATVLPVSVKTRIGYSRETLEEWLPMLLETNPAAVTIHWRTRKEMSLVPAHWELAPRAVEIRNKINPDVLLLGNGDVKNLEEAREKAAASGVDGVMLGRAVFGNPWLFEGISGRRMSSSESGHPTSKHGPEEKVRVLIELAEEFEKLSPPKSFALLKKHIKAFVTGYDGAAELRAKLMEAQNAKELGEYVHSWKRSGR